MGARKTPRGGRSRAYLEGLALLVEQMPAVAWATDAELRFTSSVGAGLEALGLQPGQVVGRSLYDYFQTTDESFPAIAAHRRALSGEVVEFEMAWGGQAYRAHVRPLHADDGRITGCVGFALDISQRARAETALRRSETHYRTLVEDSPVGIFRSSTAGRFLAVNPALVRMLGYDSAAELLGLDIAADVYVEPQIRAQLIARHREAERMSGVEAQWRRKDGSVITVRLSGKAVRDEAGAVESWEMIAEDVTERSLLEAQLRTAQKMEALGLLTGGMAHDFNNILTTVLANAELLAAEPGLGEEARGDLAEIRAAAVRGTGLIKKLLGFSRRERLAMRPIDLGAAVAQLAGQLRALLPEWVAMEHHSDPALPLVLADPAAVREILVNLAANARDAMPGGGRLRIETRRVRLDAEHRDVHGWGIQGEYVCLTVRDTGIGMDDSTRAKAFEPFFTTKPPGAGSGLGLAMVYGLVKQQNGFVSIESEPGGGTAVRVFFPVTHLQPAAAEALPEGSALTRTPTILVVEDEEQIRRAAKRALEHHGFKVLLAADGREGLDLFREREREIDLVLTDVVMPQMGGGALYEALRAAGKTVPVIFTSGHTSWGPGDLQLDPTVPVLPKPWTINEMVERVREVLARTRPA